MFLYSWQSLSQKNGGITMTDDEKNRIAKLRQVGMGYKKIASILGINESTVKSHCRRHNLEGRVERPPETLLPGVVYKACKNCGELFLQYPDHREKIFCCDTCRIKWWNSHLSQVKRKAMYEYNCPTCGKKFFAYGNRHRKYCSHQCYITARFGTPLC